MAKKTQVKITGTKSAQASALKFLNDSKKDKTLLSEVAETYVDQIQKRTRSRLDEYKQPELKESTKLSRELYEAAGNSLYAPAQATPSKSNLTFTGQLLNSFRYKIDQASAVISLFLIDTRYRLIPPTQSQTASLAATKPKAKRGRYFALAEHIRNNPEKQKTNNEIKDDLESIGFRFFFRSKKIDDIVNSIIVKNLRKQLQLYNKVRRRLK